MFTPSDPEPKLVSVPAVKSADADGNPYIYYLEPELSTATIPRYAAPTRDNAGHRRASVSVLVVAILAPITFTRTPKDLLLAWFLIFGCVGHWVIALVISAFRVWNRELYLLRQGVAVVGRVTSGTVTYNDGDCYSLTYSYWTGTRHETATVSVPADVYRRYTKGNPYITVLYDARKPARCVWYAQIASAKLDSVPLPTKPESVPLFG